MSRSSYIFFLLILIFLSGASKASTVDELKKQLIEIPLEDKKRIAPLIKLASHFLYLNPEQSIHYSTQGLPLSVNFSDDLSRAKLLRLLGQAQMYQGLNNKAFINLNKAMNVANSTKDLHLLSVSYRAMGVFYELIIDYENAMKYYIEAMLYAKESDQQSDLAKVYNNIGNVFIAQGDYVDAAKHFEKSIEIEQRLGQIEWEMNATVGLGVSYLSAGKLSMAKQKLQHVLAQENVISDFTYSEVLVNLAHISKLQKNYSQAIQQYKFVINDAKAGSYPPAVAAAYLGFADVLTLQERFPEAIDIYRLGIVKVKDKTSVESEMALYANLAKLELHLGNFKAAAKVQAEYIERRNQIQPLTQDGLVKKLESQLQMERDYIKLQEALLVSERESKKSSLYLLGIIVVSLVALVLFLSLQLRKQAIARLEATNKVLKTASETDPLTNIGNRRYLDRQLNQFSGQDLSMAFLLLDIDKFKDINDGFGHDVGDAILITLADTVKSLCRKDDLFARIGGEEFVILVPGTSVEAAQKFANRVRESVANMSSSFEQQVTTSIGLSYSNMKQANYDELYKQADIALYQAKERGRNKVVAFG